MPADRVLVTGISGFIAKHCAVELLNAGHRVRGTVRSPAARDAVGTTLGNHADVSALEFVEADLLVDEHWAGAVAGCSAVLHVASPFPSSQPKDEDVLIRPAVDGTLRVLRAAAAAGVQRFVQTSSTVAIMYGHPRERTAPYTEVDWTAVEAPGVTAYARSKTLAERAARDFMDKDRSGLHYASVNPGFVLGPALDRDVGSSAEIIQMLLRGKYPACPRLSFPCVDVRDVARMHRLVLETDAAPGGRYLAMCWSRSGCSSLGAPSRRRGLCAVARKVPARPMPDWVLKMVAHPRSRSAPGRGRSRAVVRRGQHADPACARHGIHSCIEGRLGHGGQPGQARAGLTPVAMGVLVLNEREIRRCVSMTPEAAEAVALGFTRLSEGRVSMPPGVRVDIPRHRGEVDIKTAYIEGLDHFAVKVASGFFDNASLGLPYGSGLMLVMSAITGLIEAVLLDNGYLTDLRTGIAGAIAARHLAPARIDTAGVIGSGMQARFQLRGLRLVRSFRRILVHARNPVSVERYVDEMRRELGVEVAVASDVESVVRESQFVVNDDPDARALAARRVAASGAAHHGRRGRRRAQAGARCRLLRACGPHRVRQPGAVLHARRAPPCGRCRGHPARVLRLWSSASCAAAADPARSGNEEITICDLTGVGVQDTTIAVAALGAAQAFKLGKSFEV